MNHYPRSRERSSSRGLPAAHWEVELGVVIGRTARFVPREQALDYVWGYVNINDVSARDFQFITSQWSAGKIADTFAPIGPWIADREDIPDPHVLDLRLWVNGTEMQHGNTRTFIFDVRYLVSYLSTLITLEPGDLIATGTPPGVGFARKPPVFLQPGDVCRIEIPGLGTLENTIKALTATDSDLSTSSRGPRRAPGPRALGGYGGPAARPPMSKERVMLDVIAPLVVTTRPRSCCCPRWASPAPPSGHGAGPRWRPPVCPTSTRSPRARPVGSSPRRARHHARQRTGHSDYSLRSPLLSSRTRRAGSDRHRVRLARR